LIDFNFNINNVFLIYFKVKALFDELKVDIVVYELDQIEDGNELHEALKSKTSRTSVPQVFINGQHIGGCDDTLKARDDGTLAKLLKGHDFDYDLIVIGGGSGGLAASKV
jgi:thioredoxin reductase (NADPH)